MLGVVANQTGRHEDARALIEQAIANGLANPDAHANLALALKGLGRLEEAVAAYRRAIEGRPETPEFHFSLGNALRESGLLADAADAYQRAAGIRPGFAVAESNLGNVLQELGRFDEALAAYRRAIDANPNFPAAHFNLAYMLRTMGRPVEAVAAYRRTLELNPDHADAHIKLGILLRELGRLDEAVTYFRRVLEIDPTLSEAYNFLGLSLIDLTRLDEALEVLRRGLETDPGDAEAQANLGVLLKEMGDNDGALAAFRKSLEIRPDNALTLSKLAVFNEETNRLDEAESIAAESLRISPDLIQSHLVVARCERRKGKFQEAIDRLNGILRSGDVLSALRLSIHLELGRLYDRAGDSDNAFACFSECNRLARRAATRGDKNRYLRKIDHLTTWFTEDWVRTWTPAPPNDGDTAPAFLIGFPRSGTTLLDQILDSHPGMQTLSEKPAIDAVIEKLASTEGGYPGALSNLSPQRIERLRETYFEAVGNYMELQPGLLLVDKMPFNIIHACLIQRIFPDARLILAMRHPCDACLSCFMQYFEANDALVNFFTLEDTATLYAKVMGLWERYLRVLPLRHYVIRYEDVVADFESETRHLLDFLGIEWDDRVLDYAEHAQDRGIISTPSYHQVAEPIYRRARYRWKRYAAQLNPVMDRLNPYIDSFGYSED